MKKLYSILIIILVVILTIRVYGKKEYIKEEIDSNFNNLSSIKIGYNNIYIPAINLRTYVEKANNNYENLDEGLIYYMDLNPDNRIIIFGHSGIGKNTYFNNVNKLKYDDLLILYNGKEEVKYKFNSIKIVDETDTNILENRENKRELLLVTCHKIFKSKRVVVKFIQKTS